ncbi:MAG: hypothetical protein US30_C0019G0024 [Candidatus Moranbacteria bacterium GW2011_GWF2_36_839]|nr:MAG: hypothetical protein US27_C0020G0006 [Candidatus Moranbacteria bacterium GW2011_GWF1_36_78]KKQ16321.1 MAG: hypothetical protein US30_C0019G0024 [Candidatus Moranbacteria bacterium GW2011_GWF2_36_839]HAT74198.1 hypothetical protein [Candidatus Moranbacteria bacterium]HBY10619.1 hypothetical protein [Candidatus Moranbacteria bacterium]
MKTRITKYVIAGLMVVFGALAWFSVERAINVPSSSTWLVPSIWFILFYIAIASGAILIKDKIVLISALVFSFLANFIFSFSFWHIVILFFSFFLALAGLERISRDIKSNIKFDIAKSVRTGKIMLILALSIIITSQYYVEVKDTGKINIIPKFEAGDAVNQILPRIYPELKDSEKSDLTVDEFILKMSKENSDSFLGNILESQGLDEKQIGVSKSQIEKIIATDQGKILAEQRKSFSEIAGVPLTGQEKISDVFSDMINNKINEFFSTSLEKDSMPFLPFIASFILFLTVASLGSFLGSICGYLSALVFWILRKINLIQVSKVMVEMEIVE